MDLMDLTFGPACGEFEALDQSLLFGIVVAAPEGVVVALTHVSAETEG